MSITEIGSRDFQLTYQRLTEPVKVVTKAGGKRTLGYFYPGDVPPVLGSQPAMNLADIEPAPPGFKGPGDAIRPVPKPSTGSKRRKAAAPAVDDLEDIL